MRPRRGRSITAGGIMAAHDHATAFNVPFYVLVACAAG
jgi:hypothetical protein